MEKPKLIYLRIAKLLLSLLICREIINLPDTGLYVQILCIAAALSLPFIDYARGHEEGDHKSFRYYFLLTAAILVTNLLLYQVGSVETYIYYIFPLQVILVDFEKIPLHLLIPHFILYLLINAFNGNLARESLLEVLIYPYFSAVPIIYLFKRNVVGKRKVLKLNEELRESNTMLKEYSKKIEELTITKERARIAQELHDSLGHSLMALNMNLEYAEGVMAAKPEKVEAAIKKAHMLSTACIKDLRTAVSILKENTQIRELGKSLQEIFNNVQETGKLHFQLEMDDSMEAVNPEIKNCIYRAVLESITNGVKHGKAANFNIMITKDSGGILLKIEDDGCGCMDIIESNGLSGIRNRVSVLGGSMDFHSSSGCGFMMEARIPEID